MAKNDVTKSILVAIDDGYAQTKIYGISPTKPSERLRTVYRTSLRPGRLRLASIGGEGVVDCYRTEEGDEFTVSEDIAAENTQFDSFHVSTMNRVLAHHGLALAGYRGLSVDLVTGLPVADYFAIDGGLNHDMIKAKTGNLLKGVESVSSSGPLATIKTADVGCQAVAALFDYALDDDLNPRDGVDIRGKVAIVDIGGRTTDIAVVVGGAQIDNASSGTRNLGVLDVYKLVESSIQKEFGIRDSIPTKDLDATVRSGSIRLWNENKDVSELVRAAVREIEGQILREVERKLGSAAMMSAVVFVGGGAALFKDVSARLRNGRTVDDPEFANARGLWKFATLQVLKGSKAA